jgi:hypothetical protein
MLEITSSIGNFNSFKSLYYEMLRLGLNNIDFQYRLYVGKWIKESLTIKQVKEVAYGK